MEGRAPSAPSAGGPGDFVSHISGALQILRSLSFANTRFFPGDDFFRGQEGVSDKGMKLLAG